MDREKVITGLELCTNISQDGCLMLCPYKDEEFCEQVLKQDALALLKEPATVKPIKTRGYNPPVYTHYEYECEECKSPILYRQPYCCGCGKKVRWSE